MKSAEFLRRSAAARRPRGLLGRAFAILGPGLITGAADDDPAGIITDTQAGAQFQYALAWTALVQFPLLAALQLMVARIGLVTGRDVTRVLRAHYPRWVLWATCVLLFIANTFTAGADLAGIGVGVELITHAPARWISGSATLLLSLFLVFGSYHRIVATLKWLTLALFGYVAAGILAMPRWADVLHQSIVPNASFTRDYITMVVAVFGGTISPYMLVWQSAQEVEELREAHKRPLDRRPWAAKTELGRMREDTIFGMAVSQAIEYFIFIAAGAVIFPSGLREIETARQAATALHPVGRGAGEVLFAIGMIGTGLLAVPTLTGSSAYAVSAAAQWPVGINKPAWQTKGFNATIVVGTLAAGAIALSGYNAMRLLVASQVVNGLVAPFLLVLILLIANDKRIVGAHTNGRLANAFGLLATVIMGFAGACVLWWWASDHL